MLHPVEEELGTYKALFLCSDRAGFITGENICADGGMTRLMIYHGDHGWQYQPDDPANPQ